MKNKKFSTNFYFALILAVLYLIYSAVLSPIYMRLCSDVIYLEGYLPDIFDFLLGTCQLFIWVHLFSNMLCAIRRRSVSFFITSTVVLTLSRYFCSPLVTVVKGEALDTATLIDALIYFGADMLIMAIVFVSVFPQKNKTEKKFLHFGALISAVLLSVSKITMRVIFDVFYGAPESISEILLMSVSYFSDVLYGVIVYFLICFASKTFLKEKNSR